MFRPKDIFLKTTCKAFGSFQNILRYHLEVPSACPIKKNISFFIIISDGYYQQVLSTN